MKVNPIDKVKRFVSRRPKRRVYSTEDEFLSNYAYYNNIPDDNPMDVPIQMFDRRLWAVFLGFVVLILFVSTWMGTYWYLFPSSFILIALLFILFENYANRHKLRSLISIAVMIIMSINLALTRQNSVMNKLYIIGIFGFVYLLYATIRISSYPKMIKMRVSGREILLYPRNEHDFLILKGIADNKTV